MNNFSADLNLISDFHSTTGSRLAQLTLVDWKISLALYQLYTAKSEQDRTGRLKKSTVRAVKEARLSVVLLARRLRAVNGNYSALPPLWLEPVSSIMPNQTQA